MNWDDIEGNWKQFKGSIAQPWGKLAADQLGLIADKHERLADKLHESYGISRSRDETEKRLTAWQNCQK